MTDFKDDKIKVLKIILGIIFGLAMSGLSFICVDVYTKVDELVTIKEKVASDEIRLGKMETTINELVKVDLTLTTKINDTRTHLGVAKRDLGRLEEKVDKL